MSDLKAGDIFCHQVVLHGREAFKVDKVNDKTVLCTSRKTGVKVKKAKAGYVVLLRHE